MKTQATILVNRELSRPLSLEDFLSRIFWKRKSLVDTALKVVERLPFPETAYKEMIGNEPGVTHTSFYSVIARLRACGLIYKVEGEYRLSGRFADATEELAGYWTEYLKAKKAKQEEGGAG